MENIENQKEDLTNLERLKATSSRRNRILGQLKSIGAIVCGTILTLGVVTNPIGIVVLSVVGAVCGKQAVSHALTVGDGKDVDYNVQNNDIPK